MSLTLLDFHSNVLLIDISFSWPNVDGLIYFEDLMDESSLPSSMNLLEKDYESAIRDMDGLDERIFINDNDSLLGSGSLSGSALTMSGNGTKVSFLLNFLEF